MRRGCYMLNMYIAVEAYVLFRLGAQSGFNVPELEMKRLTECIDRRRPYLSIRRGFYRL